ncbi:ABC-three component system middle component 1 [Acinetobacter baumannii]
MISIVNYILICNGYKNIELAQFLEGYFCFLFKPIDNKDEFFVTIESHNQSDDDAKNILENKADELFDLIFYSNIVSPFFKKNCTLILCQEYSKIERSTIFQIEEDPYNFKKNVIIYSENELNSLKDYLSKDNNIRLTNEKINQIINSNNGTDFLNFKYNQEKTDNYYSLIIKIILKLPFITYIPQEQDLENLEDEIYNSLSEKQKIIYKKLIDQDIEWNENDIYKNVCSIWGETE